MNVLNRLAVSLVLLVVAILAVAVALLPGTVSGSLRSLLALLEGAQGSPMQLLVSAAGLVVAVGALFLLAMEWRPRPRRAVVVTRGPSGTAELSTDSVSVRVRRAVEGVASVSDVSPTVLSKGKTVDILIKVTVDPEVDLPQKTEEIMQAVRTEVEGKMGIPIKGLKVAMKQAAGGRRVSAPGSGGTADNPSRP